MNFRASTWSYKKEGGLSTLGFLGHSFSQTVRIQNSETYSEQDCSMGMDSHYMEIGSPDFWVYNGIERVDVTGNNVHIILTSSATERFQIPDIRIKVKTGIDQIVDILRKDMKIEMVNQIQ